MDPKLLKTLDEQLKKIYAPDPTPHYCCTCAAWSVPDILDHGECRRYANCISKPNGCGPLYWCLEWTKWQG
jgi:hypothetical protein